MQDELADERVKAIIAANEAGATGLARSNGLGPGAASNRLAGPGSVKPAVAVRGNMM